MTPHLQLLATNAFGLSSKLGELQHCMRAHSVDIAIISETKFTPAKVTTTETSMPGYHPPLRQDRSARGGGVAVWVKADMACKQLEEIPTHDHEVIWLQVTACTGENIVVCALYRSGSTSGFDTTFLEYLDQTIDTARQLGSRIILAGDFNVHNESWLNSNKTTPAGEYMEDICTIHDLNQHVSIPTRGVNTLDLIVSDFNTDVKVKCLSPLGASDHVVLLADFPVQAVREPKTGRTVWRYNKADWGRLRHFYRTYDWYQTLTTCPEHSCRTITNVIVNGMKSFIPSRQLVTRPTDPAWWSPECTAAVLAKQRAWKAARGDTSDQRQADARRATAQCNRVIQSAKLARHTALRNKLTSGNMSGREWWTTIKQACGSRRNATIPTLTDQSGTEHLSNSEKAECFGRYFASKCSLGQNDFPPNLSSSEFPNVRRRTNASLSEVRFRPDTVRRELKRLNPAKATGPDGIPARVLKYCADELCLPLAKLFSLCFHRQCQPEAWKTARVVPVHKKKSKASPQNYRPVSLLSVVSKVMETITNRQIMNFLESNSILSTRQFGFRRGLGTSDLLTKLHGEWSRAAGSGGFAHVLAIDIAGAFDKVSHTGLRYKASMYGLKGTLLRLLANYLDGRRLHVVVGGQQSSEFPIQSGVPQGSILGPTLFLVYVNDSEDALQEGTDIGAYADDTTLYQCIPMGADIVQSSSRLQATVDSISQCGADWRITFEPTKSQVDNRPSSATPRPACPVFQWHCSTRRKGNQATWSPL